MLNFSDIRKYTHFTLELNKYFQKTITLEQTRQTVADRLQNREKNFLNLVKKGVYQRPASPYLKLLKTAGCEFPDLEQMVTKNGVEAALRSLLVSGVYLSWEEFKCKQDIIRGSQRFRFEEKDFDNPFLAGSYQYQSSGSRSAGTRTTFDLNHQTIGSSHRLLDLAANQALGIPMALWLPVLPSSAGILNLLNNWKVGQPAAQWFSPVDENQVRLALVHRVALRYIIYSGRFWGAKLVYPQPVSLQDAVKVAQWLETTKRRKGGASLSTFVNLAVLVCEAAVKQGIDISGAHFFVVGEPLTQTKHDLIKETGALVTPRYSITGLGKVGLGCPESTIADEVHFLHDQAAVIQRPRKVNNTEIEVEAFLYTTLLSTTTKIMLNVESDDCGVLEKRTCGCLLGQMGFDWHMYNIRSFGKLTGSGMTVMGTDLVRTLEETLPKKFGGGPADYQLLEEEDERGQTHLSLIVSPEVGIINENEIIAALLDDLRNKASGGKLAAGLWAQSGTIRVKRMHPISKSGKIVTLYLSKKNQP